MSQQQPQLPLDPPEPEYDLHIFGAFPGKTADDILDFVCEALHDWMNPGLHEGEDCNCQFVGSINTIEEDERNSSEDQHLEPPEPAHRALSDA
jgi:hypothetical protein